MEHYAGLDVSLEQTSVCVVDAQGQVVREAKVTSEPEALVGFLCAHEPGIIRVGLEAGPLSQWLHAGLVAAGFEVVLLETRHVKAALSAMIGEDGSARCARDCAVTAAWLVPTGACQVGQRAGGASPADRS